MQCRGRSARADQPFFTRPPVSSCLPARPSSPHRAYGNVVSSFLLFMPTSCRWLITTALVMAVLQSVVGIQVRGGQRLRDRSSGDRLASAHAQT